MNFKLTRRRLQYYLRECFAIIVISLMVIFVIQRPVLDQNLIRDVHLKFINYVSIFDLSNVNYTIF